MTERPTPLTEHDPPAHQPGPPSPGEVRRLYAGFLEQVARTAAAAGAGTGSGR